MGLASKAGTVGTASIDDVDLAVENAAKAGGFLWIINETSFMLCMKVQEVIEFLCLKLKAFESLEACCKSLKMFG